MATRTRTRLGLVGTVVAVLALATACGRIQPGTTYTGEGTYYTSYPVGGDGGNCMRGGTAVVGVWYAAMNDADYEDARMCGGFVHVTGPNGSVAVQIVDRCPECAPGDIDLSPEAFDQIAPRIAGRVPISWQLFSPPWFGPLSFVVKDGANQWWFAVQVRNHRNLVSSMEVLVGGQWLAMARQPYDYFLVEGNVGAGPYTMRVTDIYGEQVAWSGITMSPGVVQPTTVQFGVH